MMKLAGILIVVSLSLYAFVKGKSNGASPSPKGMDVALNNADNKQGYKIGNAADYEKSIQRFRDLSKKELLAIIETEELNLYEISNALLVLSNFHFKAADLESGIPLLETLAYDYHNPMAMVTLARLNFRGYEEEPSGTVPIIIKDLEKAFYLINRAFETSGALHTKTGEKFALDRCVANGLGVLDSYQLSNIKQEFNYQDHSERINQQVQNDLSAFLEMYQLK